MQQSGFWRVFKTVLTASGTEVRPERKCIPRRQGSAYLTGGRSPVNRATTVIRSSWSSLILCMLDRRIPGTLHHLAMGNMDSTFLSCRQCGPDSFESFKPPRQEDIHGWRIHDEQAKQTEQMRLVSVPSGPIDSLVTICCSQKSFCPTLQVHFSTPLCYSDKTSRRWAH